MVEKDKHHLHQPYGDDRSREKLPSVKTGSNLNKSGVVCRLWVGREHIHTTGAITASANPSLSPYFNTSWQILFGRQRRFTAGSLLTLIYIYLTSPPALPLAACCPLTGHPYTHPRNLQIRVRLCKHITGSSTNYSSLTNYFTLLLKWIKQCSWNVPK